MENLVSHEAMVKEIEDLLRDYMCYEYEMGCDDYE